MSGTTIYKLTRFGVIVALIAGGAVACHYKAGHQYAEEKAPGADSGSRRIVTTATPKDSTDTLAKPATPSGAGAATAKPATSAKYTHGRASVNAPKIYGSADVAPQFPGG
ncbi:MAG TPA: hypothetical protein VG605_14235, partial [Puia sp.]|nr:hypothetical protein [Puia sp.]